MSDDTARQRRHFTRRLQQLGDRPQALDWSSFDSQRRRHEVMAGIGIDNGHTVLDVGCGLGHLLNFFRRAGLTVGYTGIDLVPALVARCRTSYPGTPFLVHDLLAEPWPDSEAFDWVVACGIFAHWRDDPAGDMKRMISAMVPLARRGVALCSLSARAPDPELWTLFHADPAEMAAHARTLANRVVLREDYLPDDFALYIHR
ncbi:class I SAM-dependent methyltransferase [Roseospirillum parvum]|uniref:Methyltransferase domain-containing protein n=1 Tax=Roseospirillum parvum TaxID=83401 RepID=A0A1G8FNU6_9PROT|nr:class I SAM-dependent methyltransferase [Roseospirillum parvum]SDH83838.1 Methyltransferase domain-containing protein [Roseospirillum parvum]